MKILAIETSASACSLGLLNEDSIKTLHHVAPMQQAQLILTLIEELLQSTNVSLNQLDAIAFGCGPGSFTGVRIATSVAKGLGFAAGKPLIPISSLAALAQATHEKHGWKNIYVGVDARMQEVYWGTYQANSAGCMELTDQEHVSAPNSLPTPSGATWYGAGNAWEVYRELIPFQLEATDTEQIATAHAILTLAKEKFIHQQWVSASDALPVYVRDNVATPSKKGT